MASADVPSRARRFEALTQAVWPAAECDALDGWQLRFTGGRSKRTNSVQTTGAGPDDVEHAIEACELRYRDRGLLPIFKLTQASVPSDLDARLAARGYAVVDETVTQTRSLSSWTGTAPESVDLEEKLGPRWHAVRCELGGFEGDEQLSLGGILARISQRGDCAFGSISREGEMIAQGLVVVRDRSACLCEVGVAASERRRGHADALVRALLSWSSRAGAEVAWLQVVAGNAAALQLYQRLGFTEAYRYWYRVGR